MRQTGSSSSRRRDGVVYVPLRDREAFSTLYLAFRSRDQNAHLRGLLEELRSHPEVSSAASVPPTPPGHRGIGPKGTEASFRRPI